MVKAPCFCRSCSKRGHPTSRCSPFCFRLDSVSDFPFGATRCEFIRKSTKATAAFSGNSRNAKKPKPWCIVVFRSVNEMMAAADFLLEYKQKGMLSRFPIPSAKGIPESCSVCGLLASDARSRGERPHVATDGICPVRRADMSTDKTKWRKKNFEKKLSVGF